LAFAQKFTNKRKALEQQRKALQEQISRNKKELEKVKSEERNSIKQLEVIGAQIQTRERVIENVSQETFEISIEIANQHKFVESLKSDIELLKLDYANYLVSVYKKRDVGSALLFIFDSKSFDQALRRLKYLNAYGSYRQQQAQLILKTQNQMILALNELIDVKRQKVGLIKIKEEEKKELVVDKKEQSVLLGKVQQKVKSLSQTIIEQEKAAKKLNQSINNLISAEIAAAKKAEEIKRAKEAKKNNKPAAPTTKNSYLSDADLKLNGDFVSNKGKLPWPVKGQLYQSFGAHNHPTLKGVVTTNNGIDISSSNGAVVKTVYKGKVKGIFPIPGLDKVVLINHGEYFTVYARLETVNVKIGQEVNTDDVIGELAINAEDGTSRLHFEVWKQQVFQNPLPWLRAR
jgi:septal ring factor EnvC (AmiA/AmiB activator)